MLIAHRSQVSFSELMSTQRHHNADGVRIDDPGIQEDVRSLLQAQIGDIKRITWLENKGNKLEGQAEQRVTATTSRYVSLVLSENGRFNYWLSEPESVQTYEYAEKLNCRPGNMQCGGKCQKGTQKCNPKLGAQALHLVASIFDKVKAFVARVRGAQIKEAEQPAPNAISHKDLISKGAAGIPKALKAAVDKQRLLTEAQTQLLKQIKATPKGAKRDELVAKFQEADPDWKAGHNEAVAAMADYRKSLVDSVSAEDKIAANKFIQDVTAGDLEKQTRAEVLSAAREFHLLTGGKSASTLKYFVQTVERPHASREGKEVNVGDKPDKNTVFHEMAHHIEFENPGLGEAALSWVKERATSKKPQPLHKLMNDPGYDKEEVAYPDKFVSHYVGKVYKEKGKELPYTEVISMGVEHFSSPEAMLSLYIQDPEHFAFTLGIIKHRGR